MAKQESSSSRPNESQDFTLDDVISKVTDVATDIMASEPAGQFVDVTSEWAAEATKFIKKNPWAAVLGAAAIGYYLGSKRRRTGDNR